MSICRRVSETPEHYVVHVERGGGHLPIKNGAAPDAHVIFNAARRIAFTLKRLRDIETSQSMAYLGKGRVLDLRMVVPLEKD